MPLDFSHHTVFSPPQRDNPGTMTGRPQELGGKGVVLGLVQKVDTKQERQTDIAELCSAGSSESTEIRN